YRRPGGQANAPEIRVGDLVEATAEPGLRLVAEQIGGILLVQPKLYLADAAGQPLGGYVDEIDFLLLGPAEVRLVSAKLQRREFERRVDQRKLDLLKTCPTTPERRRTLRTTCTGMTALARSTEHRPPALWSNARAWIP